MNSLRNAATGVPVSGQLLTAAKPASRRAIVYKQPLQRFYSTNPQSISLSFRRQVTAYPESLRSSFLPPGLQTISNPASSRSFHLSARLEEAKGAKSTGEAEKGNPTAESAEKESSETAEPQGEEKNKKEGEGEGEDAEGKKDGEKKEAPPPPPPHGDKSPWQVFTETLQTEFKASKEWNESTKALAAGAQQFTENENVRRARQAYESTTGAVTSTTGKVLKSTAGAVGKGAAWTWETPVVKGVRTTVNATASVIEKGTRPLRETEAYKNVKNVIDDGSSSRYGGWVEKEERRKARELRELEEAKKAGFGGKRVEVLQEDPE